MNKVIVKINGVEYPMVGEKSEEHMIRVASYVDKELAKVIESNPKLSTSVAGIVTAINIMDNLVEGSNELDELIKENKELKKKVGNSGEELKIEMRKLQLSLQSKKEKEEDLSNKLEELNKIIEDQKKEIENSANKSQTIIEERKNYASKIEELEKQVKIADEKAQIAEKMTSKFQNDAYKVQLEKIELENEVKFLRAKR